MGFHCAILFCNNRLHTFFFQLPYAFHWRAGIGDYIINLVKAADTANTTPAKLGAVGHYNTPVAQPRSSFYPDLLLPGS